MVYLHFALNDFSSLSQSFFFFSFSCHSPYNIGEQNTHLNKQKQPIWLNITFSFAGAACGRFVLLLPIPHTFTLTLTLTHISPLYRTITYKLFRYRFCLSSLHTHAVNSALLHYSQTQQHCRVYLVFTVCSRARSCSRICVFDYYFSFHSPLNSHPFSLFICVCLSVCE